MPLRMSVGGILSTVQRSEFRAYRAYRAWGLGFLEACCEHLEVQEFGV